MVSVKSRNPFIVRDPGSDDRTGDRVAEQPTTTRLVISDVPLSYSDSEILEVVKQLGAFVLSKLMAERDRDEAGKLTHWKTGRRFVYIQTPKVPLPGFADIGPFKAKLYHKEQKTAKQQSEAACRKCLEKGHRAADCQAPIKCRQCFQEGHKAGDAVCGMTAASGDPVQTNEVPIVPDDSTNKAANNKTATSRDSSQKDDRGRSRRRHNSLQTTLAAFRRQGSSSVGSVKRKPSRGSVSPANSEKQRKLNDEKNEDYHSDSGDELVNESNVEGVGGFG